MSYEYTTAFISGIRDKIEIEINDIYFIQRKIDVGRIKILW